MNKVLLIYETRVYQWQDEIFNTGITREVLAGYRQLGSELSWCCDVVTGRDEAFCRRFNQLPAAAVNLIPVQRLRSPTQLVAVRRENRRVLRAAIAAADIVILRLPSQLGQMALALARELGKPCLTEVVGCAWDSLWNHSLAGKVLAPLALLTTKRAVHDSRHLLYVTEQFLQQRYPSAGHAVGCSDVTLPGYDETVLERRLERLKRRSGPLKLGTLAGVNVRYKGQQYVIAALAKLRRSGQIFTYEIAGSGDQTYLREQARRAGVAEQVTFTGAIPHEQVFAWLDSLDIYIQPSKQEGLPRALVEAMSRGNLCLGSTAGGIPELLAADYLVPKGGVRELADRLAKITPPQLQEQAVRNITKAREYERERLTARRQQFYREFLEQTEVGA